jgi:hypothetical protein
MERSQERLAFEVDLQAGFFLRDVRVDHLDEGAAEFLPGASGDPSGCGGVKAKVNEPARVVSGRYHRSGFICQVPGFGTAGRVSGQGRAGWAGRAGGRGVSGRGGRRGAAGWRPGGCRGGS